MDLARDKKGIELSTIIEIILVVVAAGLIISVFTLASNKADEKTSETLCRGFNSIRFLTKVDKGPLSFNVAPNACKTIDVKDLPTKNYITSDDVSALKKSTAYQIRDMATKCWWMWLEGRQTNMFSTSTLSFENKCFVCYTFSIDKDTGFITTDSFYNTLNEPYFATDTSDKCASGGGGKCMSSCSEDLPKDASSSKCQPDQKCCVADNECESKGGKCAETYPDDGYVEYNKWPCKSGKTCYVSSGVSGTYFDYIQGTKGEGGLGFIVQPDDMTLFDSNNYYAITLISPGNHPSWDTFGYGSVTAVLGVGTLAATWFSPIGKANILAGGSTLTAVEYKMTQKSGDAQANYLYISKYDDVKDKCLAETGAGQK
jgi:hypothetical protein